MSTKIISIKGKAVTRYITQVYPKQARDLGLQFFKSRFRAQGWLDETFKPWPKRKKADKRRPGRNILMDRGKLRNSIRGVITPGVVTFGTDVKYAKVHNEGGTILHPGGERKLIFKRYTRGKRKGRQLFHKNNSAATFGRKVNVGSYEIKMPQRQFMGNSAHLNKIITRKITTEVLKILK